MNNDFEERYEEHSTLNPLLFDENGVLLDDVSKALLQVVDAFCGDSEFLSVDDVLTVHLVGSNASYNYSDYSDIDLHIVVDMGKLSSDPKFVHYASNGEKALFNKRYDISIKGLSVEIYVEDVNDVLHSQGIYDIYKNEWINTPKMSQNDVDYTMYQSMYEERKNDVLNTLKSNKISELEDLLSSLYDMRRQSLRDFGEVGDNNNIFKDLRAEGIIDKIKDKIARLKSVELSLTESRKMKQTYSIIWKAFSPFKHYSDTHKRKDGVKLLAQGKAKNEKQALNRALKAIKNYANEDDDLLQFDELYITTPEEQMSEYENPYDDTPNAMFTEVYYCDIVDADTDEVEDEMIITLDYIDIRKRVNESFNNNYSDYIEYIRHRVDFDLNRRINDSSILSWAKDSDLFSVDDIIESILSDVVPYIDYDNDYDIDDQVVESPDYDEYVSEVLHSIEQEYENRYEADRRSLDSFSRDWEYSTRRW